MCRASRLAMPGSTQLVPGEPARILLVGARRWEWWRTHV